MKLARKLTLALLVAMCAVLGLHAWLQAQREAAFYEADARRDDRFIGIALSAAFDKTWQIQGKAAAMAFIDEINARPNPVRVEFVPPGEIGAELAAKLAAGRDAFHLDEEGRRLVTDTPVGPAGIRGALECVETLDEQTEYTRTGLVQVLVTAVAIAALFALLTFVLGAWFVGRPSEKLIAAAQRVGAGDLTTRLALEQKDELGALALEMNAMIDRLAAARKAVEEAANARIAALEQLRRADRLVTVGKLASGVAHELGTPLHVIAARARMIGEEAGDESRDCARMIVEQAERITRIVRQLLDFARPRKPEKTPADLRELSRSALEILQPLSEKSGVTLRVEDGDEPAVASIDAAQIQQALMNLVMNAIQSSSRAIPPTGEVVVSVHEELARKPAPEEGPELPHIRIDVSDQGEGIAPEVKKHLFEPFFTTKDVGEGNGLGLSITHGIVGEHGGFITVESEPGRGACFSIHLPKGAPGDAPAGTVSEEASACVAAF